MIPIKFFMCCLIVTMVSSISFAYLIDSEFNNPADPADSIYTKWASAGSNAVINSVFTIDVTAIPDTMMYVFEGNAGLVKQSKYQIQEFQRSDR